MDYQSVEELATAVREDRIEFTEALLSHLEHNHPSYFSIEAFFVLSMSISYVNMGRPETVLELAGEKATAKEFVRRFGLEAFVE
jgi:hypothetical protein